jgi:hypothetical protein
VRTDSDFKRIERQQLVIRAALSKALDLGMIARLPSLWDSYNNAIDTSVNEVALGGLGLLARSLDFERIDSFSLGAEGAVLEDFDPVHGAILWPEPEQTELIIERFLADPGIRDEYASVTILYPPDHPEYAGLLQTHLIGYGFIIDQLTFAPDTGGTAGIYKRFPADYTAERLERLLNLDVHDLSTGVTNAGVLPDGDIVVRLGPVLDLESP